MTEVHGARAEPRGAFVVAHRAGNDPARVRGLPAGVVIEADLHLHDDRVEVRHLKSAWPLPLLWDRRALVPAWAPRLELRALLRGVGPGEELMLDLKGPWRRLAQLVRLEIESSAAKRRYTVCARHWALLDAFDGLPVRRVHSVGSARQLDTLVRRYAGRRLEAVAVDQSLLDASTMRALGAVAEQVLTWPVNDRLRARQLLRLGVSGLISDRPSEILPCLDEVAA